MSDPSQKLRSARSQSFAVQLLQGTLFWKYVVIFVSVMISALLTNSLINVWFTLREHRAAVIRLQTEQAEAAVTRITHFIEEIEGQLGWTTYLPWASPIPEQRELDGLRLLRQVPAIAEVALLDNHGREQLRLSRQAMDRVGSNADFSGDETFRTALANRVYYGPVYFHRGSEPFMTLAVSGTRRESGVSVAEVNLTHIWDVINQIRVGQTGRAYVVDAGGRLIAHPDISLVLRNTDLSYLAQVRTASTDATAAEWSHTAHDVYGHPVLTSYAVVAGVNWRVFVELPEQEANAPLYAAATRSIVIVLAGLGLALFAAIFLARHMVVPIRALTAGAARIGAGALDHRITIKTGDELEALGEQLNDMATQLQGSYSTLERKVEERTHQLQVANQSKTRFLAVASHDLRQPLHALNLFVAQLRSEVDPDERQRLTAQIDSAVTNMNDLFNALLDITRLDAGALTPTVSSFPANNILRRIEATFAAAAHMKGLHFRVVASSAWIRSDPILLERILLNLVSNAVRYTTHGGIVVGCRRHGQHLQMIVCDSGIGIAEDQQQNVFAEFHQLATTDGAPSDGLGLGLAIVERLCKLLGHDIRLISKPGSGSRFTVSIPMVPAITDKVGAQGDGVLRLDPLRGKLVIVIDDDALVLTGTAGLLQSWGCHVVIATSERDALAGLDWDVPELIISDFTLKEGRTGIDAIARIREVFGASIPAVLISGDILPERMREAREAGLLLLHKPVSPMTLRAALSRLVRDDQRANAHSSPTSSAVS